MQSKIIDTVVKYNTKYNLFNSKTPILIMLSGGSDSVALTYIMYQLHKSGLCGEIAALHVNHMLRGKSADNDANFVEKLCKHLAIPLFMAEVDIASIANENNANIEATGRQERYSLAIDALSSLCNHAGISYKNGRIATAHTLNDRAENFYMRSIVGTGPFGLTGISHITNNIIRPVLDIEKEELKEFIKDQDNPHHGENGELWCSDATNEETDRFRTYIRNEVMPLFSDKYPHYLQNLRRTMDNIAETKDYIDREVYDVLNKCTRVISNDSIQLLPTICGHDKYIIKQVVYKVLSKLLGSDSRINGATIDAVMKALDDSNKIVSGYVVNIQNNLLVSANKQGILIEPAETYRIRRNKL